jgi:hypothetical protein
MGAKKERKEIKKEKKNSLVRLICLKIFHKYNGMVVFVNLRHKDGFCDRVGGCCDVPMPLKVLQ